MAQSPAQKAPHPDLHVAHAIPGRIRLRTPKIRGRPRQAQEIVRKLSAVPGVRRAGADPATGSITVHYHPSALDAAEFVAEIAAALGLIAEGIGPGEVEAMFQVLGVSPAEARESWGAGIGPNIALALALVAAGALIGRRSG